MDVGVRELKQHLADYLDRAEKGEIITITDRGRPKVQLVPLPGGGDRLAEGIEQGWITAPTRPGPLPTIARFRSAESVMNVLDGDRGD